MKRMILVPRVSPPNSGGGGAVSSVAGRIGDVSLTKADVGLANADNTYDVSKPVSTAQQTALDLKQDLSEKAAANGYASLDSNGLVPVSQLPASSVINSVKDYGAVGNGVANDTAAIQAALDIGGIICFPAGTYLVSGLTFYSNTAILGIAGLSIVKHIAGAAAVMLTCTSASAGTYIENVTIKGLTLYGLVETEAFSQYHHLVSANGVRNLVIKDCIIKGFRGDGIYLGAHTDNTRHNVGVVIENNIIDGINKDNRNGLSIVDGSNITVRGNIFQHCTRSTMPGPLDIEPNHIGNVLKNIKITGNHFSDTAASSGVINVVFRQQYTAVPFGFIIESNTSDITDHVFFLWDNTITFATPQNIVLANNIVEGTGFFFYTKVNGVVITGNTFREFGGASALGANVTDTIHNVSVTGNTFIGDNTYRAMTVRNCNYMQVANNVFYNFLNYGILVGETGCNITHTTFQGNIFNNITGAALLISKAAGSTVDGATCSQVNNIGTGTYTFP